MVELIGGSASGLSRDLNVCQHQIGQVKRLYNRGDLAGANTLLGTVITDLTALKLDISTATNQTDLAQEPTLNDPVWTDGL